MLSQTREQKDKLNIDIDVLMSTTVKSTIEVFMSRYSKTIGEKLGLDADDLKNDMREQVWKGLITFSKNGKANIRTYLNRLIENRFNLLISKCNIKKYKNIEYFSDIFESGHHTNENFITEETGETLYEKRERFIEFTTRLPHPYKEIYLDLTQGFSINELGKRHSLSRIETIAAINKLDIFLTGRKEA